MLKSIPIPELELRVSSNSGMELTTCLKYIHDNILSLCTTATGMNSIIELKQAYVCGAFVHAPYYLADAFSIKLNNYIYIYIYTYIYIIYIYVCVCACSIYKVKMSQA